jgi:hypothetical protein
MSISYHQRDELPPWEPNIELNGERYDFSVGWTFRVVISPQAGGAPELDKDAGIAGFADGVIQVNWLPDELDLDPATYDVDLIATRTSDNKEFTISDDLIIRARAV